MPLQNMFRRGDAFSELWVRYRCPNFDTERENPGPGVKFMIFYVVHWWPGTNLGRSLTKAH
jgi:hypothetical protein